MYAGGAADPITAGSSVFSHGAISPIVTPVALQSVRPKSEDVAASAIAPAPAAASTASLRRFLVTPTGQSCVMTVPSAR